MDNIGELDSILDEEDGDVVSNKIPVTFLCVELDSKTADITDGIGRTPGSEDGREPGEDGGGSACVVENSGR
jgi:hypothetical protein